jgi:hypothetical protein
MQGDAGGRIGTSELLKQLVTLRLPVTTDQKAANTRKGSQPVPAGIWANPSFVCQREIRHIDYFDDATATEGGGKNVDETLRHTQLGFALTALLDRNEGADPLGDRQAHRGLHAVRLADGALRHRPEPVWRGGRAGGP